MKRDLSEAESKLAYESLLRTEILLIPFLWLIFTIWCEENLFPTARQQVEFFFLSVLFLFVVLKEPIKKYRSSKKCNE